MKNNQSIKFIFCACGCGGKFPQFDWRNRPRRFIHGHNPLQNLINRFWKYTQLGEGCWFWIGNVDRRGYGRLSKKGTIIRAARLSWEIHNGSIPKGMEVCHSCDNPACVKPMHLFLATHKDNMKDMAIKKRGRKNQEYYFKHSH